MQFCEARFGVGECGVVDAREARCAAFGHIGGYLHLPYEREHVGEEPRLQQHCRIDVLRLGVVGSLLEDRRERLQGVDQNGKRCVVDAEAHGGFLER